MRFRDAVHQAALIRERLRDGLQAVRAVHRGQLSCSNTRRIRGSVSLDDALRIAYPQAARWDYAIGIRQSSKTDVVVWLEVHPASSLHVDEVLNKLAWLRAWLRSDAPQLGHLPALYCRVATGKIAFRRGSGAEKRIAQKGLRFPVKQLDLDRL
jgi:hypothetical protein